MTIKELYEEAVERGAEDYEIEVLYNDDYGYNRTFYATQAYYNELMQEVTLE